LGHWLRRWWPASQRDGITGLDRALLDVEVALLTAGAQGFFTDDTLDSDVAELLAPQAPALTMHVRDDDPLIRDLVRAGAGLADDIGVDGVGWSELFAALHDAQQRPLTESVAWDHDWTNTSVVVGADRSELRETRERVRGWARARLDPPAAEAFLAEILAGESSY
jgi:hypothetical protein